MFELDESLQKQIVASKKAMSEASSRKRDIEDLENQEWGKLGDLLVAYFSLRAEVSTGSRYRWLPKDFQTRCHLNLTPRNSLLEEDFPDSVVIYDNENFLVTEDLIFDTYYLLYKKEIDRPAKFPRKIKKEMHFFELVRLTHRLEKKSWEVQLTQEAYGWSAQFQSLYAEIGIKYRELLENVTHTIETTTAFKKLVEFA